MGANFNRVMRQRFAMPVMSAVVAVPAWIISWQLAPHVVTNGGGFSDFWLGGVSIITGIAAIVLTGMAIINTFDSVDRMLQE